MNKQASRVALGTAPGIALAVGAAVMVLAMGSCTPESGAPIDDATEGRTPIDVAALGPQVGEQAPGFSLPDQNGEIRTLESILGPRGALLLFHRSADW